MNANKLIIQLANKARHISVHHQHKVSFRALPVLSKSVSTNVLSQLGKERDTFQDVLPSIIESLVTNPKISKVPELGGWIKQVLEYNLEGGKKTRGLTTVFAYEMLEKPENITRKTLKQARILGWCVEILQAYFLVVDDIMDGSETRRGLPCWYRMPYVGLGAVNDSILIYCSIQETLKEYFGRSPQFVHLMNLFNESLLYTSMGQHLDYTMAHRIRHDYSLFTLERYYSIVKHKTSYYTFNLPVSLGLLLANNTDRNTHHAVREICFELGKLFQIQDDYIDCFGDEKVTGKMGTDIQEGKCSWLAVNALQLCNKPQKDLFVECYASKEPEHISRIKDLYRELEIPELYRKEEQVIYESIVKRANALPADTPPALFIKLIDMLYKRKQ